MESHIYFSFKAASGDTYNSYAAVFDLNNGLMTLATNMGATAFVCNSGTADNEYFYRLSPNTGAPDQGKVFNLDTGAQDYGTSFACTLKSKHFPLSDHDVLKRLRHVWLNLEAETDSAPVTITASINRGQGTLTTGTIELSGFSRWGSFVWGRDKFGGGDYHYASVPFAAFSNGREFQIIFTKTDAYRLKLFSYKIEFRDRPIRRR